MSAPPFSLTGYPLTCLGMQSVFCQIRAGLSHCGWITGCQLRLSISLPVFALLSILLWNWSQEEYLEHITILFYFRKWRISTDVHPILGTYQWSVLNFGSILLKQNTGLAGHMKHLFNGKNYMVRFLAVRSGPITDSYLAFGSLFPRTNSITQPWCKERSYLSPQLEGLCFAQVHGKPASFWVGIEEWTGRGIMGVQRGEGTGGEGGETEVDM